MGTQLELAKNRLFDVESLHASNVKLFPGSTRDLTAEQFGEQVYKAIAQIEAGDFEIVENFED
jgi:hypothetical protein